MLIFLQGNRFTIALRNVIGDDCTILTNLNSLKEMGFINYHEPQRFGTRHMPTHFIGKQLLLGNWKEVVIKLDSQLRDKGSSNFSSYYPVQAINLILEPECFNSNHLSDVTMALIEYKSSKDAPKAYGKITRNFQTIEAKLLLNLTKCGEDIVGALNTVRLLTISKLPVSFDYFLFIYLCFRYPITSESPICVPINVLFGIPSLLSVLPPLVYNRK